jgi:uncharacterized OsmC-like protein
MATTQVADRVNGIDVSALGKTVAAMQGDPELGACKYRARNRWVGAAHNRTTIHDSYAAKREMPHEQSFQLDADEPPLLAGGDSAPSPVEHLLNALAACLTTSMVAHAAVRGIEIDEVESEVEGDIDLRGFLGIAPEVPKGFTDIRVRFRVKASPDNLRKLERLTEFSPVFNTITKGARVDVQVSAA